MGGFFEQERCIKLLQTAAVRLWRASEDEEMEAVEQAIALLKARPTLTEEVLAESRAALQPKGK